jgi:membrane-associated phospholipid phosphatase
MRGVTLTLVVTLALLGATPALADTRSASPFSMRAEVDGPIIGGAIVLWVTTGLLARELAPPSCYPCSPSSLNGLDRPVTRWRFDSAAQVSDGLVVGIPAAAVFVSALIDVRRWGWRGAAEDLLLVAEAMALAGMVQQITAMAVRRPRPYMYRADTMADERDADAGMSFFSGHTTAAFAAATAFATTYSIRRPRSTLRPLVWILSLGAASAVPVLRVASGRHFWSDVLVGAAVGSAFGVLVPHLHRRTGASSRRFAIGPGPGAGIGILGEL